jgi:hypothetical protein
MSIGKGQDAARRLASWREVSSGEVTRRNTSSGTKGPIIVARQSVNVAPQRFGLAKWECPEYYFDSRYSPRGFGSAERNTSDWTPAI